MKAVGDFSAKANLPTGKLSEAAVAKKEKKAPAAAVEAGK